MADALSAVPIQELRTLGASGRLWGVDRRLDGLETLTPVRGWVQAIHRGEVLEVSGEADTIVTLCCDRCLQPYNHPLHCRTTELIQLEDPLAVTDDPATRAAADDLSERLDPRGRFDPAQWVYEQLCLRLPLVNRCGGHCPGPDLPPPDAADAIDPRWAALHRLRSS
jgi:uncharacterized protein